MAQIGTDSVYLAASEIKREREKTKKEVVETGVGFVSCYSSRKHGLLAKKNNLTIQ